MADADIVRILDLALTVLLIEIATLVALRFRGRRAARLRDFVGHLLAGAFLLLALRARIRGAPSLTVMAFLFGSLGAHLVDLRVRWLATPMRTDGPLGERAHRRAEDEDAG